MSHSKLPIIKIEVKLDGKNYQKWSMLCRDALETLDLWALVEGTATAPEGAEELANHKKREQAAKSQIIQNMSIPELDHIESCNNAKECWDALKDLYEPPPNIPLQVALSNKLFRLRMRDGDDLPEYLATIHSTVKQLKEAGRTLDDGLVATLILNTLPADYDVLCTILRVNVKPTEELSSRKVTQRLLAHNLAKEYEKLSNGAMGPLPNVQCFDCGNFGHKIYDRTYCPYTKRRIELFGVEALTKRGQLGKRGKRSGGSVAHYGDPL